jgi:hypothetical protein
MSKNKIKSILDAFDWETVKTFHDALGWKWTDSNGVTAIPTVEQMKGVAQGILLRAAALRCDEAAIASSGFYAEKHDGGDLELSFEIARVSSFEIEAD